LSGLSKVSALPQMKLAWIASSGPEEKCKEALARLEVIADTYLSLNSPIQLAAPTLLQVRKHLQPLLVDRLRANMEELDAQLARQQNCERLDVQGGWYAVLRVPAIRSDEELAVELLKSCLVAVHPGHFYDFAGEGYLVVSLITPHEQFREGVRRVLQFVNS
jgi:alanine-synthesizing transaminase